MATMTQNDKIEYTYKQVNSLLMEVCKIMKRVEKLEGVEDLEKRLTPDENDPTRFKITFDGETKTLCGRY